MTTQEMVDGLREYALKIEANAFGMGINHPRLPLLRAAADALQATIRPWRKEPTKAGLSWWRLRLDSIPEWREVAIFNGVVNYYDWHDGEWFPCSELGGEWQEVTPSQD